MHTHQQTLLDALATTGVSVPMLVKDYESLLLEFVPVGFTGTIKFVGSYKDDMPDFDSAQSISNAWDYVKVIDVQDGAGINGDTGIPLTTITDVRMLEVNTSRLVWVGAVVTARSAGAVTAKCTGIYKA